MSGAGLEPAQGPLADPEPEVGPRGPRRCERCGTITGLLVFVPNIVGRGRRVCLECLRAIDQARTAPPEPDV